MRVGPAVTETVVGLPLPMSPKAFLEDAEFATVQSARAQARADLGWSPMDAADHCPSSRGWALLHVPRPVQPVLPAPPPLLLHSSSSSVINPNSSYSLLPRAVSSTFLLPPPPSSPQFLPPPPKRQLDDDAWIAEESCRILAEAQRTAVIDRAMEQQSTAMDRAMEHVHQAAVAMGASQNLHTSSARSLHMSSAQNLHMNSASTLPEVEVLQQQISSLQKEICAAQEEAKLQNSMQAAEAMSACEKCALKQEALSDATSELRKLSADKATQNEVISGLRDRLEEEFQKNVVLAYELREKQIELDSRPPVLKSELARVNSQLAQLETGNMLKDQIVGGLKADLQNAHARIRMLQAEALAKEDASQNSTALQSLLTAAEEEREQLKVEEHNRRQILEEEVTSMKRVCETSAEDVQELQDMKSTLREFRKQFNSIVHSGPRNTTKASLQRLQLQFSSVLEDRVMADAAFDNMGSIRQKTLSEGLFEELRKARNSRTSEVGMPAPPTFSEDLLARSNRLPSDLSMQGAPAIPSVGGSNIRQNRASTGASSLMSFPDLTDVMSPKHDKKSDAPTENTVNASKSTLDVPAHQQTRPTVFEFDLSQLSAEDMEDTCIGKDAPPPAQAPDVANRRSSLSGGGRRASCRTDSSMTSPDLSGMMWSDTSRSSNLRNSLKSDAGRGGLMSTILERNSDGTASGTVSGVLNELVFESAPSLSLMENIKNLVPRQKSIVSMDEEILDALNEPPASMSLADDIARLVPRQKSVSSLQDELQSEADLDGRPSMDVQPSWSVPDGRSNNILRGITTRRTESTMSMDLMQLSPSVKNTTKRPSGKQAAGNRFGSMNRLLVSGRNDSLLTTSPNTSDDTPRRQSQMSAVLESPPASGAAFNESKSSMSWQQQELSRNVPRAGTVKFAADLIQAEAIEERIEQKTANGGTKRATIFQTDLRQPQAENSDEEVSEPEDAWDSKPRKSEWWDGSMAGSLRGPTLIEPASRLSNISVFADLTEDMEDEQEPVSQVSPKTAIKNDLFSAVSAFRGSRTDQVDKYGDWAEGMEQQAPFSQAPESTMSVFADLSEVSPKSAVNADLAKAFAAYRGSVDV